MPSDSADGVLTIGTLLPVTGPGNEIGIAAINAVNVGISEINERDGVLQQPVRWVNASEGDTVDETRAGIEQLLQGDVDAIIGPASSVIAIDVLGEPIQAVDGLEFDPSLRIADVAYDLAFLENAVLCGATNARVHAAIVIVEFPIINSVNSLANIGSSGVPPPCDERANPKVAENRCSKLP